jgi:hypothetical protein
VCAYLGVKGATGEIIICIVEGVCRASAIRRRPEELRWKDEELDNINGEISRGKRRAMLCI